MKTQAGVYWDGARRHKINMKAALKRGYMYAVGYDDPPRAAETVRRCLAAGLPCERCDRCTVRCAMGFDVRSRALAVASLPQVRV